LPTAYADTFGAPAFEERFALFEGEVGVVAEVGTEEDDFVFMFCLHGSGTGRQYGIDAAYSIAHFPTSFENIFGLHG
jgi:hypothetical protein